MLLFENARWAFDSLDNAWSYLTGVKKVSMVLLIFFEISTMFVLAVNMEEALISLGKVREFDGLAQSRLVDCEHKINEALACPVLTVSIIEKGTGGRLDSDSPSYNLDESLSQRRSC